MSSNEPRWATLARVCEVIAQLGPERYVELRMPYVLDSVAFAIGTRVAEEDDPNLLEA